MARGAAAGKDGAVAIDFEAVLSYSRELQRATDLRQLLEAVKVAVERGTRYRNVWLAAFEDTAVGEQVRVLSILGPAEPIVYEQAPTFPTAGDPMLQQIRAARAPVVVVDARTDARTNKDIVARVGNRTLINVPLLLGGTTIGALGIGTYGDEGCLSPTPDELELLTIIGLQLAPAFDRVRMVDRARTSEAEREELRRRLHRVERIETLALLSGGVAHDFNNLLTVIINSLHFLSEAELPAQSRDDVRDASEAANRAREVTQQLLAMGRKQSLRLVPTDWSGRVKELVRLLRRLIPETVEVVVDVEPRLPPVLADGHHLDQVVMNLALNARDAMPSGGRLVFSLRPAHLDPLAAMPRKVRAGPAVSLTVTDSGTGMAPAVVEHIFEPFFTTKGAGVGTGLGLAIALGVVEQHGGLLECRSAPGLGSTFTVTLPVAPDAVVAAAPRPEAPVRGGDERILAAEDDAGIRELLQRILAEAGYRVTVVGDGYAAVEAAQEATFDLVLLDAVMPRMTGREAFEAIRVLQPTARALFMTGYAADTLPAEFLAEHQVELVEKPWLPAQLLAAVRRGLDRSAATERLTPG